MDILNRIDEAIENCTDELTQLTMELINIKSVKSAPVPGGPFGAGVKQVLDKMLTKGEQDGFYCTDHKMGIATIAMKDSQPDLGIWLHADVVPEGTGWDYEPYNATLYKGCIIGRGATDNKGQLAASYLLLKIFKDLNIPLSYNPALYLGSNEETGMADLVGDPNIPEATGFLNVCTPPALSLVPDSGFPVGYGGKGALNVVLKSDNPLHGIDLIAGTEEAPGRASASLDGITISELPTGCSWDEENRLVAETPPVHGAHPDPNGNMITVISEALLPYAEESDRHILTFLRDLSRSVDGSLLDIKYEFPHMPPLTVFSKSLNTNRGHVCVHLNIRYPYGVTIDTLNKKIAQAAKANGFTVSESHPGTPAYLLDPNSPVVNTLCQISNEVIGENKEPYALSGGTYAHRLPNAYPYGMSACEKPEDFPKGHGSAHGIDELVSLKRLKRAMRIYARALLALQDIPW